MNTCLKGKRVEREAANFLTANGIPAVRGARNGVKDGQDLILPPEYDIHIEVKGDKSVRPGTKAMEKAIQQAKDGAAKAGKRNPCVLWKEDRKGWIGPGTLADLAVLSADPTLVDPSSLADIDVLATVVGGEVVWDAGIGVQG